MSDIAMCNVTFAQTFHLSASDKCVEGPSSCVNTLTSLSV
jgi:hypothetical protein